MMKKELQLISIVMLILLFTSFCTDKKKIIETIHMSEDNMRFKGNIKDKQHITKLLDEVLKDQGDFGAYGDLSCGIKDILKSNRTDTEKNNNLLNVIIYPISGEGHDFSFIIDLESKTLRDLVVGELEPEPDFED